MFRGSLEATKYAQSLIEALINDTDKKFEQQLPKMKPLQPASTSQKQKAGKSTSNGATKDDKLHSKQSASKSSAGSVGNFTIGAWQQPPASSVKSSSVLSPAMMMAASPWSADSTTATVRASPEMSKLSYSDRAKTTVVAASSCGDSSAVSWSPPVDKMTLSSMATSVNNISSGGGASVHLPMSQPPRCEPQPLPIITATGFAGPAAVSRLSAAASSVMRDYSPFNNTLSQIIAESVLTKRTDDFASVAAAGVITSSPPMSVSYPDDPASVPAPASASDPHKAPGYKLSAYSGDPAKAPGHRLVKDTSSRAPQTMACSTAESAAGGFRPTSDYGRPSSTPNAVVSSSLVDNSGPVGPSLGASLDRPQSFYMAGSYRPNLAYPVPPPPPPGLMQLGTGEVFMPPSSQLHQFGAPHNIVVGGAVTETSVLAAPLMATSLASASAGDGNVHQFNFPPSVTTTSDGN